MAAKPELLSALRSVRSSGFLRIVSEFYDSTKVDISKGSTIIKGWIHMNLRISVFLLFMMRLLRCSIHYNQEFKRADYDFLINSRKRI